ARRRGKSEKLPEFSRPQLHLHRDFQRRCLIRVAYAYDWSMSAMSVWAEDLMMEDLVDDGPPNPTDAVGPGGSVLQQEPASPSWETSIRAPDFYERSVNEGAVVLAPVAEAAGQDAQRNIGRSDQHESQWSCINRFPAATGGGSMAGSFEQCSCDDNNIPGVPENLLW
ncbi:unnamed protein product, partial [Symbiodinium sp. CCMP2592]